MALLIGIEIGNTGIIANYWRVETYTADLAQVPQGGTGGVVTVQTIAYVSLAVRANGGDPVPSSRRSFTFPYNDFPPYVLQALGAGSADAVLGACYIALKTLPMFQDASDT